MYKVELSSYVGKTKGVRLVLCHLSFDGNRFFHIFTPV